MERVFDEQPRERFRGVVRRGFFAVPASKAVDETALGIDPSFRTIENDLFRSELADAAARHEPARRERVHFVPAEHLVFLLVVVRIRDIFFHLIVDLGRFLGLLVVSGC